MPIQVQSEICIFDQAEYTAVNRQVLRLAFDIHNEFGKLLNEELYKRELAARCVDAGHSPVEREVRIQAMHGDFRKDYVMDMIIAKGLLLEAKSIESLTITHRTQTLNYLLLTGMRHGTLINFRTPRVEHQYVSTNLTPELRHKFTLDDRRWLRQDGDADWLKQQMVCLLEDWGAFLDVTLYREAIIHLLKGTHGGHHPVGIVSGTRLLGTLNLSLLTEKSAFIISAVTVAPPEYESHLSRMLHHTNLNHMHWINLNHHNISFTSLSNSSKS